MARFKSGTGRPARRAVVVTTPVCGDRCPCGGVREPVTLKGVVFFAGDDDHEPHWPVEMLRRQLRRLRPVRLDFEGTCCFECGRLGSIGRQKAGQDAD